ncbi:MAG: MBL fold metallo-hydrolase [archaeon GB-1867-035]|nr:MBL fold metallo-hydrolase [Candidatus Culexmicrobium profundum]
MPFFKKSFREAIKNLYEIPVSTNEVALLYFNYSGVLLRTQSQVFAFDLANLLKKTEVDLLSNLDAIFYTHGHYDHYNKNIAKLLYHRTGAQIIAEPTVASDLKGIIPEEKLISAKPGETFDLGRFKVTSIRGLHRGPIVLYLVEGKDLSLFHGGDSAYVPLEEYKADLALVPTGSPSPTASPQDAFRMISALNPKVAAAFHGSKSQHQDFINLVRNSFPQIKVLVLEEGKVMKIQI